MVKKPAKIQIGRLRYFDASDLSRSKALVCDFGSDVLRYAKRANAAPNEIPIHATAGGTPPAKNATWRATGWPKIRTKPRAIKRLKTPPNIPTSRTETSAE